MTKVAGFLTNRCLLLILAATLPLLAGCVMASGGEPATRTASAAAPVASPPLEPKQRSSYALGMVLGNQFRAQSVEVDPDLYLQGLKDALAGGRTLLTEAEARGAVEMLQRELKRRPVMQTAATPAGIDITFKLDPRLTRGMYMGDRWVSPPVFSTVQQGQTAIVEARANVVGTRDPSLQIAPQWVVDDPEMVTVAPVRGDEVTITVKRAGQSWIRVVAPDVAKKLQIRATYQGDAIQVDILQ